MLNEILFERLLILIIVIGREKIIVLIFHRSVELYRLRLLINFIKKIIYRTSF